MLQITRLSFGKRTKFHQLGSHDSSHRFPLPKLVLRRLFDVIEHDELGWNLHTLQMETKLFFQSLRYRRGELSRLLSRYAPHPGCSWRCKYLFDSEFHVVS